MDGSKNASFASPTASRARRNAGSGDGLLAAVGSWRQRQRHTHPLELLYRADDFIPHARADFHLPDLVDEAYDPREGLARLGGVLGEPRAQHAVELPDVERVFDPPGVAWWRGVDFSREGRQPEERVQVVGEVCEGGVEGRGGEFEGTTRRRGVEEDDGSRLGEEERRRWG